jgi:hypothetical protein
MTGSDVCNCCEGPFQSSDRATCTFCGGSFHLAMRTDVAVQECGQVWINDELEALEFGCNRCLEKAGLVEPASRREGSDA